MQPRSAASFALAAVIGLGVASPAQAQSIRHLSLADYMDMESVGDPQISPDGTRIVYTRGWIDAVNDRRESSLWVMDADGERNRNLLDGSSAAWSPDGTRILYTAPGEPGGAQIHVRWMDAEGATSQITPTSGRARFTSRTARQTRLSGLIASRASGVLMLCSV